MTIFIVKKIITLDILLVFIIILPIIYHFFA